MGEGWGERTDHHGPNVDEGEQDQIAELVERQDEGENVVGHALREAVERVEGVRGVRRGHDPLVVRLVQVLVDGRVVQGTVDPVDSAIGEHQEYRELRDDVPHAVFLGVHVQLRVALDFGVEERGGEDGHHGHRHHRLHDFLAHLVLEEFGVLEGVLVENEDVGERREREVDDISEEPV